MGNYYGLELPGPLTKEAGRYVLASWRLSLAPKGAGLEGTLFFNALPITLTRTRTLPSEVAVPDLPRGPGPAWQVKLGGPIYAPVATRDSLVYVGTSGGMFYAIGSRDGRFVWAFGAGRPIHGGAATTDDALSSSSATTAFSSSSIDAPARSSGATASATD